jgi:hypothetical protein
MPRATLGSVINSGTIVGSISGWCMIRGAPPGFMKLP